MSNAVADANRVTEQFDSLCEIQMWRRIIRSTRRLYEVAIPVNVNAV